MQELAEMDKKILMLLQKGLPFCRRPYAELALQIGEGVTETEVIERISRLKRDSIIRRMSGFFNSQKLGYAPVLCAIKVAEENIVQVARVINQFPGITHNYERDYEYNMWFTLLAVSEAEAHNILTQIENLPEVESLLKFYAKKRFKLNVTFKL